MESWGEQKWAKGGQKDGPWSQKGAKASPKRAKGNQTGAKGGPTSIVDGFGRISTLGEVQVMQDQVI